MATRRLDAVFIGGYTKSGTTLTGRAFDLINTVYAKGEFDFFRIFAERTGLLFKEYNKNIAIVNREVYDNRGSLNPVSTSLVRRIQRDIFLKVFFAGEQVPDDCQVIVEKSPRNVFHLAEIRAIFPASQNVIVYREPKAVFRSLCRHLADHRDPRYFDPDFDYRQQVLVKMERRWNNLTAIIEAESGAKDIHIVRYDAINADKAGFLDYVQKKILRRELGLKGPVSSLDKESYLASLPPEQREISLVQSSANRLSLSEREIEFIDSRMKLPEVEFDY
ncbi:sulfotransferase [Gimibacter soli]|uniref:Sulfotransferase n=1 Tax=Gimibacter soli TaxID=3024400 RepID=A0AAE9XPR9_9PROT|nr:sulfotransferase [Gimibacter soli]WCL54007.1 sulfotransferase [Gimibacter soli]